MTADTAHREAHVSHPRSPDTPDTPDTDDAAATPRGPGHPDGAAPVLALRGVSAALGGRPVLRGVDLTVRRGEAVALLGANGSGKSTLVRATVGEVPLTDGELTLFGTPLRRFRAWWRVGYVPQRATAATGVAATVREVVTAGRLARRGLRPLRREDRAAVDAALELVGLADRARDPVGGLSGGQHQRVLIARALAGEPELLLMDEPLAGVDLDSQQILAEVLRAQLRRGTALLVVLHEQGPLRSLLHRAVLLEKGRIRRPGGSADAFPPDDQVCHPHAEPGATDRDASGTAVLDPGLLP